MFPGLYSFDGDNYIACPETYLNKHEEDSAPFIKKKALPLLGESCTIYPTLRRIVYTRTESQLINDDFSGSPAFIQTVRHRRISFEAYIDKLQRQQSKISQTLGDLAKL